MIEYNQNNQSGLSSYVHNLKLGVLKNNDVQARSERSLNGHVTINYVFLYTYPIPIQATIF